MKKILIIQTAFIGDVVLATSLIEKWHQFYPESAIDFLVRKGNETILDAHPYLNSVLIWDKKNSKLKGLFELKKQIKSNKYDVVVSAHRFASSGFLVAFSGAKYKIGFKSNPFSFKFTHKPKHEIGNGTHEIERNQLLIEDLTDKKAAKPKLHLNNSHFQAIESYTNKKYVCMSPASVWFTKQLPKQKWLELIKKYKKPDIHIYILGGPNDKLYNDFIMESAFQDNITNLSGELSILESTALMKGAEMNYVNDSGPLHFASSVNAPVTAFFCSTVPNYGFGPLSDQSILIEPSTKLSCHSCGLHGFKTCPKKHFKCGHDIEIGDIIL